MSSKKKTTNGCDISNQSGFAEALEHFQGEKECKQTFFCKFDMAPSKVLFFLMF